MVKKQDKYNWEEEFWMKISYILKELLSGRMERQEFVGILEQIVNKIVFNSISNERKRILKEADKKGLDIGMMAGYKRGCEDERKRIIDSFPKERVCNICNKPIDDNHSNYEGELKCPERKFSSEGENGNWEDIGYNKCLREIKEIIKLEGK